MSSRAASKQPEVTREETENALSAVHSRIEQPNRGPNAAENLVGRPLKWRWVAAAAVVVLLIGTAILFAPQTATAPRGEITSVELPDGSAVELNSGSRIRYNRLFALTNRTVRLDGEAYFSVEDGEQPFIVTANNTTVKVSGTKFNIRSWSGDPGRQTEVAVSEGSVLFYPLGHPDRTVTIRPGELSTLKAGLEKPTPPEAVSIDRILGWRDRMLIFNDKSLLVIFRELERRFDVEIRLEDQSVAHETLTAYYTEANNVESVLRDICRVKGLHYSETANGYRVYQR